MHDILLIGEILIDMVTEDYTENLENAFKFERYAGGSPANIAANLSDLGLRPHFISRVGNDSFGDFLKSSLKERGVSLEGIQTDEQNHTSMVFVTKSRGNPQFFPARAADHNIEEPHNLAKIVENCEFFHFSSWPVSMNPSRKLIIKTLELCRKHGTKICFDPNYRKKLWEKDADALPVLKEVLSVCYLCKPSLDDSYHIFGDASKEEYLDKFHGLGVENVILTMGKDGAIISDGNRREFIKPVAKKAVDATGAGDGFWSGVYLALVRGNDIFKSARIGNAIAAYRVESVGAGSKLPEINRILDLYDINREDFIL